MGDPLNWTQADAERLRVYWTGGASLFEMASVFSRSISAVSAKAHRMGLTSHYGRPGDRPLCLSDQPPPRASTCQWIEGEPSVDDDCKCGDPNVMPGKPYCHAHCERAYIGWAP